MRRGRWVGLAAAGAGAAVAAGTAGVVVERRIGRNRKAGARGADELGGLRSATLTVLADDGVKLHAEVDEVAPYADQAAKGRHAAQGTEPTLVFVHGYALNLDCFHFQRAWFRGKHTMV